MLEHHTIPPLQIVQVVTPDSACGHSNSLPQASPSDLCTGDSDDLGSGGHSGLMQSIAQLVVAAQTRAMSAQSLPPIAHFSGEGTQSCEEGFDRWIEQFEERARLVGWPDEHRKYHLKMLLDKAAFQTCRLLPDSVKANYSETIEALRKRFKPISWSKVPDQLSSWDWNFSV